MEIFYQNKHKNEEKKEINVEISIKISKIATKMKRKEIMNASVSFYTRKVFQKINTSITH